MFLSWKLDRLLALSLMPLALCMPLNKTAAQEAASPEALAQSVEAPVSQAPSIVRQVLCSARTSGLRNKAATALRWREHEKACAAD